MAKHYDYIIAGGGCAGLSLAYTLHLAGVPGKVLIADRLIKAGNDRTWAFWAQGETPFAGLVQHEWTTLSFADRQGLRRQSIQPYRYQLLRSADFYRHIQEVLAQDPRFEFRYGEITQLQEGPTTATLQLGAEQYQSPYLFNGMGAPAAAPEAEKPLLLQHFLGWWIETAEPSFDPTEARLMDFRVPQELQTRFVYVLPVSPTRALVEFTIFSDQTLPTAAYADQLEHYLATQLQISNYQVVEDEYGVIPMSNQVSSFQPGQRIIPIGGAGGAIKPTTGYAFQRIQRQAKQLVDQLQQGHAIDPRLPTAGRFKFYDALLLRVLQEKGTPAEAVFSRLFRHNRFARILQFLDEQTQLSQEIGLLASLPYAPFLRALVQHYALNPGRISPVASQPWPQNAKAL